MIDIYFKHLTRKEGETLTDDSPFITHRTNSIYGVKKKGFYSSKALQKMLERLRYDANIDSKTVIKSGKHAESGRVRNRTMRAHVFRKIFNTRCVENNVNHTVKESLMGHKAGLGQDVSYFRGNNIKELAEYMKVVESLTIRQENKLSKKLQDKDNVIYVQLKEKYEQINKLWKVVKESRESNEAWKMHTFNALQGVIQMKQDEINKLKTIGKIIIKRKSS